MLFSIFWLFSMAFLVNDGMRITDWPVNEWSRRELICQGASSLSNAELLAIFLHTGVSGKSAVDLARGLGNAKYA